MLSETRAYLNGYSYQSLVAFLAGVAGVAASFAVAGNTEAFVGVPMFSLLVEYTPGAVVTFVLETLGTFGQTFALLGALALCVAFIGGLSFGGIVVGRKSGIDYISTAITFLLTGIFAVVLTAVVVPSVALATAAATVVAVFDYRYERTAGETPQPKPSQDRRRALQAGAGTFGVVAGSYLLGRRRTPEQELKYLGPGESPPAAVRTMLDEADEKSFELSNAPGLVSEYGEFYTIDINTVPPQVDKESWSLEIGGMVENEVSLTYDELTSAEPEHRFVTLRCVGDDLNGRADGQRSLDRCAAT